MLICSHSWQCIFLTSSLLPEHTLKTIVCLFLLKPTTGSASQSSWEPLQSPRVRRPGYKSCITIFIQIVQEIKYQYFLQHLHYLHLSFIPQDKPLATVISSAAFLFVSSFLSRDTKMSFFLPNILIISRSYELSAMHTLKCFSNEIFLWVKMVLWVLYLSFLPGVQGQLPTFLLLSSPPSLSLSLIPIKQIFFGARCLTLPFPPPYLLLHLSWWRMILLPITVAPLPSHMCPYLNSSSYK